MEQEEQNWENAQKNKISTKTRFFGAREKTVYGEVQDYLNNIDIFDPKFLLWRQAS